MIRYSCHSENFGILSAEHTFSLIHDLQFDCIDIASRSLIPQMKMSTFNAKVFSCFSHLAICTYQSNFICAYCIIICF